MAQRSCAYGVYKVHSAYLSAFIKDRLLDIVPEFHSRKVITDSEKEAATDESKDESSRVEDLTKVIKAKIKESDDNFHEILDAFSVIGIDVTRIISEFESDIEKSSQASSRRSSFNDSQSDVFMSSFSTTSTSRRGSQGSMTSCDVEFKQDLKRSQSIDSQKRPGPKYPRAKTKSESEKSSSRPKSGSAKLKSPYKPAVVDRRGSVDSCLPIPKYEQKDRRSLPDIEPPTLRQLPEIYSDEQPACLTPIDETQNFGCSNSNQPRSTNEKLSLDSCQAMFESAAAQDETTLQTQVQAIDSQQSNTGTQETGYTEDDADSQIEIFYQRIEKIALRGVQTSMRQCKRELLEENNKVVTLLRKQFHHELSSKTLQKEQGQVINELESSLADKEAKVQELKQQLTNAVSEANILRENLAKLNEKKQQCKGVQEKITVLEEVDKMLNQIDDTLGDNPNDEQWLQQIKSDITHKLNRIVRPTDRPHTTGTFRREESRKAL